MTGGDRLSYTPSASAVAPQRRGGAAVAGSVLGVDCVTAAAAAVLAAMAGSVWFTIAATLAAAAVLAGCAPIGSHPPGRLPRRPSASRCWSPWRRRPPSRATATATHAPSMKASPPVIYASIPSPSVGVWHLGPLPVRAYALCILTGIIVATIITDRRLRHRGYPAWVVVDIAIWAVPAGIIGARLYHLATDPELYFAAGRNPWDAFAIWNGGLGIWGAVAGGALGAWIGGRKAGVPLAVMADALAPALPVAQALGRFGNYFNQELFGRPTTLPWGLLIDPAHRPAGYTRYTTFHPTFLYEVLWDLGVALLVWSLDRVPVPVWTGVRPLRHGIRRRPVLDRRPAHRHRQPPARPAPE